MQFAKNVISSVVAGSHPHTEGSPTTSSPPSAPVMPAPDSTMLAPGQVNVSLVATLVGHEERVWSIDWHPTEPVIASCSSDKTVRMWSPSGSSNGEWRCIETLDGEHARTIRQVAWSPDGNVLAAASFDATVSLWRKTTPQFEMEVDGILDGHENEVKSVAWDSQGRCLATCSRDKSVWIWDRGTGGGTGGDDEDEIPVAGDDEFECAAVLTGHSQDIKCVRWLPHTRVLMSCGYDDTIKVWQESRTRKDDWHCTKTLTHHTGTIWQLAFPVLRNPADAAHSLMLSCSDDATIQVWKRGTPSVEDDDDEESRTYWVHWTPVATVSESHSRTIYGVDWAPPLPQNSGSTMFASCGGDDKVVLHQATGSADPASHPTGQSVKVAPLWSNNLAHEADVNCVKFCSQVFENKDATTGKPTEGLYMLFATCGDDYKIKVWRVDISASTTTTGGDTLEAE